MLRRLALALLPVALLAAACGGGGGGADDSAQRESLDSPAAVGDIDASGSDLSGPDDNTQREPADPPASDAPDADLEDGDGGAGGALLSTLNPFQLLGGLSGQPSSGEVDPTLQAALLDGDDVPAEFLPFGGFAFAMPSEFGPMEMAASMFASGDLMSGDFGAMVMSAVLALPPEAIDELGDLSEFDELTEADLTEIGAEAEQFGIEFSDLRVLDASGLGDGGVGMHMAMDFGGLFEAFEAPQQDIPFSGIAMDMYMFLRGERALMVMVMWPTGELPGVDGRDLAETMDAKAAAAF